MKKLMRIMVNEYKRNVFKKSFLFVLLSVPAMMALNIGVGFYIESSKDSTQPIGIVDLAGVFEHSMPAPEVSGMDKAIEFMAFQTEVDAQAALKAKEIQAYYLLPTSYPETRRIVLVFHKEPGENATRQFFDYLQVNLLASKPAEISYRAAAGSMVIIRSLDGKRELFGSGPTFGILMPLLITLAILGMLLMSSGYLMSAVVDEKENRTMEILATSASPGQLIGGKVFGVVAIGFTMLTIWGIVVIVGIFIARKAGIGWFEDLGMNWSIILASAAIAIPAYILVAALMTAIGSISGTTQEAQSLSTIFIILHLIPLYISIAYINNPQSPLAVFLSFMPFSALLTISMRNIFAVVPAWQVIISVCIQTLCAIGGLWLASRAFRLGMLHYGQRMNFHRLFRPG